MIKVISAGVSVAINVKLIGAGAPHTLLMTHPSSLPTTLNTYQIEGDERLRRPPATP